MGLVDWLYLHWEQQQQCDCHMVYKPLVALRKAGYIATNTAALSAAGSPANALIELRSLS
jgi:hypothetical protein